MDRDEILRRAHAVPVESDPYSQRVIDDTGANTGYRRDCSGWVSYCWHCPTSGPGSWGGYSTATFITTPWSDGSAGIMYEIPRDQLQAGDAIGYCGPNTAAGGGGHIALWLGKSKSQEHVLDHGSGMGPKDRLVTWGVGTGWQAAGKIKAYRFRGVESDAGHPTTEDVMLCKKGDGGPVVETLQLKVLAAGGTLPKFGVDGSYGNEVAAALVALGVVGGDQTGGTYGPWEYVELDKLIMRRQVPAGPPVLIPHTHDLALSGSVGPAKA